MVPATHVADWPLATIYCLLLQLVFWCAATGLKQVREEFHKHCFQSVVDHGWSPLTQNHYLFH